MVTLTIISLLAAMLMPALAYTKRRTQATAVSNDLRVLAGAFNVYAHEVGSWPAEVDAGVAPPEMAGRIASVLWTRKSPIGGQYNWDSNQVHYGVRYKAVIAISGTTAFPFVQDISVLEAIDRAIDDGVLTTGNFRLGANDEPIFIIAQ